MSRIVRATTVASVLLATSATLGAASPATPDKGTACYVTDANGAHYLDTACSAQSVTKYDADGNFAFYVYQDAGQLPPGAAFPSSAIHATYEQCFDFGGTIGIRCGTVTETTTPSGAYKSSFSAH